MLIKRLVNEECYYFFSVDEVYTFARIAFWLVASALYSIEKANIADFLPLLANKSIVPCMPYHESVQKAN